MVFAQNYAFTITPAHKLRYAGTVINQDLHPLNRQSRRAESSSGKIVPRTIDKIQIGIQLHNTANFPISLYLESADTEMEGNKPPRGIFPKPPITVFPGNVVMVIDDPIDMKQAKCEKIEGRMLMKVRYGLRGKEVNDLTFDAKIEVLIREDGYIHGNYTHWNANPG